ncbi:MFS transporter [Erythrobacter sp. 3-20A1M]|uniref:MFS transporter n=1 Tax=Erythrobacter sp. 3-20A1M TaxID=2653850 RepID=UPI001BFC4848|nr:MFS transporter [Erythrobacter sp. 3-20A1M]QWC55792.1 MFS transporter [Erythrobacter sp. 3-20A1M]
MRDTGISKGALGLATSLATAGYAFGALLAGDIGLRFHRRPLFALFTASAAVAWTLTVSGMGPAAFAIGLVLAGLSTGLLLVVALPPCFQHFPASRLHITAAFVNIALFGGIAAGPLMGGLAASGLGWRTMFTAFAAIAALACVLSRIVLPHEEPPEPGLTFDWRVVVLSAGATILPFGAVAFLPATGFVSPLFLVPLAIGLASFAAIFIVEDRAREPLIKVRQMLHTLPIIGTIIASFAGGVFLTLLTLSLQRLTTIWGWSPGEAGLAFWPLLPGALLASVLIYFVFRTRYLPIMILAGMSVTAVAGGLLMAAQGPDQVSFVTIGAALLGFGAGSTVSPALFLAAFSVPSNLLGRVFAFIELVRSVGDFLIGPVLAQFAVLIATGDTITTKSVDITLGIAVAMGAATLLFVAIAFLTSYRRLPTPKLEQWLDGEDEVAIESPPVLRGLDETD